MDATFSISVDATISAVRITMAGFFAQPDIDRFVAARDKAHARLRCGAHCHVTLVDITRMKIQSRDSVEAFACVLSDPRTTSKALGFIIPPHLARAQIQRAAAGRDARFFASVREAEQWLREVTSVRADRTAPPPTAARAA